MDFELIRKQYKPNKVRILFVGESRPYTNKLHQDPFFYLGNSILFSNTKKAFEKAGISFGLEKFKELGCWLYDVCDYPINHYGPKERKEKIKKGIPAFKNTIQQLKPEHIIVVKRGDLGEIVMQEIYNLGYDNSNSFNLPFPACGNQLKYIDELSQILEQIL